MLKNINTVKVHDDTSIFYPRKSGFFIIVPDYNMITKNNSITIKV